MKSKIMMMALLATVFGSVSAMANEQDHKINFDKMHADMTTIRQAANELRATNPDLSNKLVDIADKKDKMIARWTEKKDQKAQHIAGMRQAAAELKATNPNLAKQLEEWADKKERYSADKEDDNDRDD